MIEPNYQERGAHDYRLDACLTIRQLETVLLRCIIYYNTHRLLEHFPYTDEMLSKGIIPCACAIWDYGRRERRPVVRFGLVLHLCTHRAPESVGARNL